MLPLKLFLLIVLLLHNANSREVSRFPNITSFPLEGMAPPAPALSIVSPAPVISKVSQPSLTADNKDLQSVPVLYPPRAILRPTLRPLPTRNPTVTVAPTEAGDAPTEKLIIVYPSNQLISSMPSQLVLQNTSRPTSTTPGVTSTWPRRTTMQKYSTPLPSRSTRMDKTSSPITTGTVPPTTTVLALTTTTTAPANTTTLQPTTTTSYPPATTPQTTIITISSNTITPQSKTTTPYPATTTPQAATTTEPVKSTTLQPTTTTSPSTSTPHQTTTTLYPTTQELTPTTPFSTTIASQPTTVTPRPSMWTQSPTTTTSQPIQTLTNFTCNIPDQYHAITTECDSYIECKKYVAIKMICPDGLQFKNDTIWPDYPCAYPSQVKCAVGAVLRPSRPTVECPRQYGYYSLNDGDCSKYIICQEGVATIMNCPYGLVFNNISSCCDWPINVPSCNPEAFNNFKCPAPPVENDDSDIIYKFKYSDSCDKYIACQQGYPRLLSCDNGLSFDENKQTCVASAYVTNCSFK